MPLVTDNAQIDDRIGRFAEALYIATVREVDVTAELGGMSEEVQLYLDHAKEALAVLSGGGLGVAAVLAKLDGEDTTYLCGKLVCLSAMMGVDYAKAFTPPQQDSGLIVKGR